jgi:hypothetical protein
MKQRGRANAQFTVRAVPKAVDEALRERARKEGKSLNQVLVEALKRGLDVNDNRPLERALQRLAGTWVEDPAFDEVMKDFERINPETWK